MAPNDSVTADVYTDLGLERVVNARGNQTVLGGSRLSPRVLAAMESANASFVDLDALLTRVGDLVAEILGCEAAYPTSGCAAAMALGTAACMAGDDQELIAQLPDTTGMRNKVVIQSPQRNEYDRMPSVAGAQLVVVEPRDWEASLTDDTAAVFFVASYDGRGGSVLLSDAIPMAHARGIPVIVDAAGSVSPPEAMNEVVSTGADLIGFGAKYFGAPNSTGLLCGRRDLVRAAALQGFIGFELHGGTAFGRGFKLDRAEAVAVHRGAARMAQRRLRGRPRQPATLAPTPWSSCSPVLRESRRGRTPSSGRAVVTFDPASTHTAETVAAALSECHPPIWARVEGTELAFQTNTLSDDDLGDRRDEPARDIWELARI